MCKTQILISHIRSSEFCLRCAGKSYSSRSSVTLPFNLQCVTEALLLYDCEEGGHVPSVDAHVQGMLGKVVRGHSLVQWTDEWREMGVRGDPLFSLSPSLPLLPFVCLSFLHIRAHVSVCVCAFSRVCVCIWACVCVCLLWAHSRSMLLIDSCGCWAAHWRRGQSSNEFLHLVPLAPTPTPPP